MFKVIRNAVEEMIGFGAELGIWLAVNRIFFIIRKFRSFFFFFVDCNTANLWWMMLGWFLMFERRIKCGKIVGEWVHYVQRKGGNDVGRIKLFLFILKKFGLFGRNFVIVKLCKNVSSKTVMNQWNYFWMSSRRMKRFFEQEK